MYLTQFPINLTRRQAARLLADPYRMHAAVAGSFPQATTGASSSGRLLWRIDRLTNGATLLYIVSPTKPSLVGLDEQIGWPDLEHQWRTANYDAFLTQIEAGQTYSFRLTANPVYRTSRLVDDHGRKLRVAHLTVTQQAAWLIGADAYRGTDCPVPSPFTRSGPTRAEANGFAVVDDPATNMPSMLVTESRSVHFRRRDTPMTLVTARYDGVLRVTNADALRHALTHGIGKAKGFGCGLLTLARIDGA